MKTTQCLAPVPVARLRDREASPAWCCSCDNGSAQGGVSDPSR